jgi:hypothetical protein
MRACLGFEALLSLGHGEGTFGSVTPPPATIPQLIQTVLGHFTVRDVRRHSLDLADLVVFGGQVDTAMPMN